MSFKLMVFCVLLSFETLAQSGPRVLNGYDPVTDIISEKYEAGPFLIYDCEDKHWVCVLESYYKTCEKERAKNIHEKNLKLGCAPVAELPNKKSCFQKQLLMVSQNQGTKFCVGEDWKQKEIDF